MAAKKQPSDPGLEQIDEFERRMVQVYDEKVLQGVDAAEVARLRPGVVAQARAVCDQMRQDYLRRQR